jgi:aminoglycoside phosphotransferase (APT) family kinase protein
VRGWGERYAQARTDAIPQAERVAAWLEAHRPAESGAAFLHGDYKYDNLVLDPAQPTRIVGVLDWEMATVGDPLMDLGTTLGYWLDPGDAPEHRQLPFGPTLAEGNLTRAALVERYAARAGRELGNVVFYYVFGLFKILVIAQQIYKRFAEGKTSDPRFAAMIQGVRILATTADRAIEKQSIGNLG